MDKKTLEALISQEQTIGNYVFDEDKKCFFGDAEIELYLKKMDEKNFRSEFYYFDGYEIWLENHQKEIYNGTEEIAKQKAIDSFNSKPEMFKGFPILYKNISCVVHEAPE